VKAASAKKASASAVGRRERGKLEKLARIRAAAHLLFAKQGFANTTTKQIAAEADIGSGTLFLYARTKEDLLVLIFQDEIGAAVDRAFARVPRAVLLDQVLHVFNALIAHHAADPALGRVFVKELPFVDEPRHGVAQFVNQLYARLGALIDVAKARGEIAADVPSRLLAQNLFASCFQHLQMWLGGAMSALEPDDERLRAALELQLRGALLKE
jgi:TetR/AcrR family transcriptional regulator, cholesterol catabolism regulator